MDPQRGAETAESRGIRCQCVPPRHPARTEPAKQGFGPPHEHALLVPGPLWAPYMLPD